MRNFLCEHFRCPERFVSFALSGQVSGNNGYFRFGDTILYGKVCGGGTVADLSPNMRDCLADSKVEGTTVYLPFDAAEALNGLRYETYHTSSNGSHPANSLVGRSYYLLRPLLPVKLRRNLQKIRLTGWTDLKFPNWPVDRTVDSTLETLLLLSLKAQKVKHIPLIWFWPNGALSCALMSHDVEAVVGRDFCSSLMDIDDAFDIKSSFQIVPETRYEVSATFLESIRTRGFEINVQDLNHDGHLFRDRNEFLSRAKKINAYGREFRAAGFRSAILYRRQEWYDALEFEYDMSVPNVAHLDPQRGGCCTVMPYFVGDMVELPVTMTQDYTLFHILNDHSLDIWKRQIELVMAKNGLIHFIVHPDYITEKRERSTYENLLAYLNTLRNEESVWMPLPGEAAAWWKERSQMRLVEVSGSWQIEGKGKERARIAYASEKDGQLVYSFNSEDQQGTETDRIAGWKNPSQLVTSLNRS